VTLSPPNRSVLVVTDPEFGSRLAQVPPGRPLWIVRSAVNEPVIQAQWAIPPDHGSTKGITAFRADPSASRAETFMANLDAVDTHHGPHSSPDAPYTELESIGALLTPEIRAALSDWLGFNEFAESETGFVARRSKEAAQRLRG